MNWSAIKTGILTGLPLVVDLLPGSKLAGVIAKSVIVGVKAIDGMIDKEAGRRGITRDELVTQIDAGFAALHQMEDADEAYYQQRLKEQGKL